MGSQIGLYYLYRSLAECQYVFKDVQRSNLERNERPIHKSSMSKEDKTVVVESKASCSVSGRRMTPVRDGCFRRVETSANQTLSSNALIKPWLASTVV
jgi:hypothetical protein